MKRRMRLSGKALGGGVAFAALSALVCAACDSEGEDVKREQRGLSDPPEADDLPPPEYYPDDNRVIGPPFVVTASNAQLVARRAARFAEDEHRRSPAGWRERIAPFVTEDSAVVIARFDEARGNKYSESTDSNLVEVLEHLSGRDLAGKIELIQSAGPGGGLTWAPGMVAALVLEPSTIPGAFRILTRPTKDVVGWAVQVTPEKFESSGGVRVDRLALESLGGPP